MYNVSKPFRTISEQIEILINRGLIIDDESYAEFFLSKYGYYNVINGYKDLFTYKDEDGEEWYKSGTSFRDLTIIYHLDKRIREVLIWSIQMVEESLSANIAYIISENFGVHEDEYIKKEHFKSDKNDKGGYKRDDLIKYMKESCKKNIHPMEYYRVTHGFTPPWIMIKGLTFGNLVTMSRLFKSECKYMLIKRMRYTSCEVVDESTKEFFTSAITFLYQYRNWAAHGGRIYNHKARRKLIYHEPAFKFMPDSRSYFNRDNGQNDLFAVLICLYYFHDADDMHIEKLTSELIEIIQEFKNFLGNRFDEFLSSTGIPRDYEVIFNSIKSKGLETHV